LSRSLLPLLLILLLPPNLNLQPLLFRFSCTKNSWIRSDPFSSPLPAVGPHAALLFLVGHRALVGAKAVASAAAASPSQAVV
jgi:hypothetical protein